MAGGTATSEHRTGSGTSLAHLLNGRARALVQLLSLAVAAGNPEHTRTVSGSTGHNTDSNSNRASLSLGRPSRAIGVFIVTAVRAITTATTAATASRVASTTWVVSRELEGDCRVNHRHQGLDGFASLVVESRIGVNLERFQSIDFVTREIEDSNGGVIARGLPVVVWLNSKHNWAVLGRESWHSVLDSLRGVVEDLRRRQGSGCNKGPGQLAVETKLEQDGVRRSLGDLIRRGDRTRERGWCCGLRGLTGGRALCGGDGRHDKDGRWHPVVVVGGGGGRRLRRSLRFHSGLGRARFFARRSRRSRRS